MTISACSHLSCVHISHIVIGKSSGLWLCQQTDGVWGGDFEAQTVISIRGQSCALGQGSHSDENLYGVTVTAAMSENNLRMSKKFRPLQKRHQKQVYGILNVSIFLFLKEQKCNCVFCVFCLVRSTESNYLL